MPYILSPRYQLRKLAYLKKELPKKEIVKLKKQDTFVLVKDQRRSYLINRQIYQFLKFLRKPQSKTAIEKQFSTIDWYPFFKQMLKRRVLIDATSIAKVKREQSNLPTLRLSIGQTLGGYQITQLLAFRNSTQTCIAKKGKKKVVIKTLSLPKQIASKKRARLVRQFEEEFELMQQLPSNKHLPNLLFYDAEEQYAVMEYVPGLTLDKALKRKKRSSAAKQKVIHQLVKVLAFLHQHQIIHGDLHHRNILISKKHQVTLIDFGLSHHQQSNPQKKGGIDLYLPPERICKSSFQALTQPATFRSDIYQLGILLYYILFEKFPFSALTWDVLYEAIQQGQVTYPSAKLETNLTPYVPILQKCLQVDPLKRYENAMDITTPPQS